MNGNIGMLIHTFAWMNSEDRNHCDLIFNSMTVSSAVFITTTRIFLIVSIPSWHAIFEIPIHGYSTFLPAAAAGAASTAAWTPGYDYASRL